jgi:hypothetical protein
MMEPVQTPAFRSMSELTDYLSVMETRLATMETENKSLRNALSDIKHRAAAQSFKVNRGLPETGLISDSFFTRAFTVWGHYLVAQLIISIPLFICYLVFFFTVMNNLDY